MKSVGSNRWGQMAGQWVSSLGPTVVVVVCAVAVFKDAVVSSIASTPHPELVYAILGAFFLGVLLASMTLWRYNREVRLIEQWLETAAPERASLLSRFTTSYLMPIYEILLGRRTVEAGSRQAVMEQEMSHVQSHLEDRLAMPHYLAGALVGLGLVGTFIGLLGTLDDLGKLFGALAQTDSSANTNPAELFADMVRRLQDPMRGMGTAFVASLYGLLGSLVLGLQILVVSRVGHNLASEMHTLLRDSSFADTEVVSAPVAGSFANFVLTPSQANAEPTSGEAFQRDEQAQYNAKLQEALNLLTQLHQNNANQQSQAQTLQADAMQQLMAQMRRQQEHQLEALQAAQNEQTHLWQQASLQLRQQFEASLQETQLLKSEVRTVVESVNALALAVRHNLQAEELFRASVPRTSYWQDAWIKVQAYLQRAPREHALGDVLRISQEQTLAMSRLTQSVEKLCQLTEKNRS